MADQRRPRVQLDEIDSDLATEIVRARRDRTLLQRVKDLLRADRKRRGDLSIDDAWTASRRRWTEHSRELGLSDASDEDYLSQIRNEDQEYFDTSIARMACRLAGYREEIAPYLLCSADAGGYLDRVPIDVRPWTQADREIDAEVDAIFRERHPPTEQERRLSALWETHSAEGIPTRRGGVAALTLAQRMHALLCAIRGKGPPRFEESDGARRTCTLCRENLRTLERWINDDAEAKRLLAFFDT